MTTRKTTIAIAALTSIIAISAYGAMMMAHGRGAKRPAASELGPGPRVSPQGLYVATLQVPETLKARKMYVLQVSVTDAAGQPVDGATITVDGGMPEHGHGLPTRPRVTKSLGGGVYEISGVRFNMGGWWELKLAIQTPSGSDTVTFNLTI